MANNFYIIITVPEDCLSSGTLVRGIRLSNQFSRTFEDETEMAKLRKRKTNYGYVYDIDFTYEGKRYIRSTKTSDLKIAKQVLAEIQSKIVKGAFNLAEYGKKQITLSRFFEEYFSSATAWKSQSTILNEKTYAKQMLEYFGNVNLRTLDLQKLDKWKAMMLKQFQPTTFNIRRRFLHAAFNKALEWGYLDSNVIGQVDKVRVEEERNFFTEDEIKLIFTTLDKDIADPTKKHLLRYNAVFRQYVEFLLNTGLRRNEALFLTKEHIDLEKDVVYIQRTKGKTFRIIPLNVVAKRILTELGDKLFSELKADTVSHKFNDILKRIGLAQFKLHSLRHTFATSLISAGADLYAVNKLLGHSDIRTSMIYAKVNTDTLRDAVSKLNSSK